jgi:hypothetical protein
MRIRHQCTRHRDRQCTRIDHLLHRRGFESLAPLAPGREFCPRRESRAIDRASQRRPQFVGQESRRIGHDVENLRLKLHGFVTVSDQVPDKLVREKNRLAHGHAKADEVFGLHSLVSIWQPPMSGLGD